MGNRILNTTEINQEKPMTDHINAADLEAITTVRWLSRDNNVIDGNGSPIATCATPEIARHVALMPRMAADLIRLRAEVISLRGGAA